MKQNKQIIIVVSIGMVLLLLFSTVTSISNSKTQKNNEEVIIERINYDNYDILESTNYINKKTNSINLEYTTSHKFHDKTFYRKSSQIGKLGLMNSPWPMKCHDLHHTGRSPIGTADNPYDELWKYEFDGSLKTSPAIDNNGTIYVGGSFGELSWYLFAIYPNGTLKWRYRTEGTITGSCPAINENGTVYIASWDNCLHAVYSNGTRKWVFDAGADIVSSPTIAEDGTLYFGTMMPGYEIIAVNPNGSEKWRYQTGYDVMSDPAIGDDGTIYIGSSDEYLYALYPNGTLRWRYKTDDWIVGPPSIADDGTIYVGSFDGYLYALYQNGTLRWRKEIWYGSGKNPTIGSDGKIYISSATKLFAIFPEDGDIDWDFDLGGHSGKSSSAICANGIIYTGIEIGDRDGGEIVAVNSDGSERWRQRISNRYASYSSPAIDSNGTVYICSTSKIGSEDWGHLHAFNRGELAADTHGPYIGILNEPVQFTGSASGGYSPYSFHWDFGDDETSEEQNPTHEYSAGNYTITLTVTDDNDTVAVDTTWALIRESNDPPDIPLIDGETQGNYGESYDYTFISNDIDGDGLWYYIEWGDGETSGWIGPYSSGQEITVSHTWNEEDTYTIRAKAKDVFDAESNWSILEVTMPVNQHFHSFHLLQRILELFPNAFPILRQLLGLES